MKFFAAAAGAALIGTSFVVSPADASVQTSAADQICNAETNYECAAIARLVQVWGFVKYHHPASLEGRTAMDVEFFELHEKISGAGSLVEADRILADWIASLPPIEPCTECAKAAEPEDIAIPSATEQWLASLPQKLSAPLRTIYENRPEMIANFHVEKARGVGNPIFKNEADYSNTSRADEPAIRLLGFARAWNTLRYWFPYRDVMDVDADTILHATLPAVIAAQSTEDYGRAMALLAAASDDGHVGISAYEDATSPAGSCVIPYSWRYAEGRLVVDGSSLPDNPVLQRGDVITAIDGEPVDELEAQYGQYIAASNEGWLKRVQAARLARGDCEEREISVERQGQAMTIPVTWLEPSVAKISLYPAYCRPGDTIQQLEGGITYACHPSLKKEDLGQLIDQANAGNGLVIDMRGYVRDFLVFELGGLLTDETVPFVRFTSADVSTPGQFTFGSELSIAPDKDGRAITVPVVAIINEAAVSSPEYHAMAYRAAGVKMIGSPTAGADGNVSQTPLPLGETMRFSGIGVYYPDKSPTQRVGIVPDILVEPTVAGIAAGRDEQLERAIAELRLVGEGSS